MFDFHVYLHTKSSRGPDPHAPPSALEKKESLGTLVVLPGSGGMQSMKNPRDLSRKEFNCRLMLRLNFLNLIPTAACGSSFSLICGNIYIRERNESIFSLHEGKNCPPLFCTRSFVTNALHNTSQNFFQRFHIAATDARWRATAKSFQLAIN